MFLFLPVLCFVSFDFLVPENRMRKALDCADVLQSGIDRSGIYQIWPINRLTEGKPVLVYCDMATNGGGWTVSILEFSEFFVAFR